MLKALIIVLFLSLSFLSDAIQPFSASQDDSLKEIENANHSFVQHTLSLNGLFSYPFFYKLDPFSYSTSNTRHFLNSAIHAEYTYSTSSNFGVGIEYGLDFSRASLKGGGLRSFYSLITNDVLVIEHEGMHVITNSLMPKIEWKRKNSKRPYGFVHQFGIGIWVADVLDRDYEYELVYASEFSQANSAFSENLNDAEETYNPNQLYNFDNKPYWGGALMYSLTYRGKLSESLLWSVGLRTQVSLSPAQLKRFYSGSQNQEFADQEDGMFWLNRREMRQIIAENRRVSILQLQFGLVYKLNH